jgi:hypothetical protein
MTRDIIITVLAVIGLLYILGQLGRAFLAGWRRARHTTPVPLVGLPPNSTMVISTGEDGKIVRQEFHPGSTVNRVHVKGDEPAKSQPSPYV